MYFARIIHINSIVNSLNKSCLINRARFFHTSSIRYCEKKITDDKPKKEKIETYEEELARLKATMESVEERYQRLNSNSPYAKPPLSRFINPWRIFLVFFLIAGSISGYFWWIQYKEKSEASKIFKTIDMYIVGKPFSVIDHNGNEFTEKNIDGKYTLMCFGFIHSPDVTPEILEKLTAVLNLFTPEYLDKNLNCVFVTVDPKRDTPEALKEYLSDYHPRIIGVTGKEDRVRKLCRMYKSYSRISMKAGDTDYIMSHSHAIYLIGRDRTSIKYCLREPPAKDIVDELKYLLSNGVLEKETKINKIKLADQVD